MVAAARQRAMTWLGQRGLVRPGVDAVLERAMQDASFTLAQDVATESGLDKSTLADRKAAVLVWLATVDLANDLRDGEAAAYLGAAVDRAAALQTLLGHAAVDLALSVGVGVEAAGLACRCLAALAAGDELEDDAPWSRDRYLADAVRSWGDPMSACMALAAGGTTLATRAAALGRSAGLVTRFTEDLANGPRRLAALSEGALEEVISHVRAERDVLVASGVRAFEQSGKRATLERAAPAPIATSPGEILVAEDDVLLAKALSRRLSVSHAARVVGSISEVRRLRAEGRSWIGAIIDIRLPDGSGLDLLESLRNDGWNRPALVLTGHLAPELINRAATLGASYVVKPAPEEILTRFLSELGRGDRDVEAVLTAYGERYRLTPGERRVLELSVRGVSREAIAEEIGVSENTLKSQVRSLLGKIPGAFQLGDVTRRIWSDALGADKDRR